MSDPKYIVGIDLGTTHCVLAYTAADAPEEETPEIHLLEIPQVVSAGEVKAQPLLPSFLFLPGPHDVAEGGLALPWNTDTCSVLAGVSIASIICRTSDTVCGDDFRKIVNPCPEIASSGPSIGWTTGMISSGGRL